MVNEHVQPSGMIAVRIDVCMCAGTRTRSYSSLFQPCRFEVQKEEQRWRCYDYRLVLEDLRVDRAKPTSVQKRLAHQLAVLLRWCSAGNLVKSTQIYSNPVKSDQIRPNPKKHKPNPTKSRPTLNKSDQIRPDKGQRCAGVALVLR